MSLKQRIVFVGWNGLLVLGWMVSGCAAPTPLAAPASTPAVTKPPPAEVLPSAAIPTPLPSLIPTKTSLPAATKALPTQSSQMTMDTYWTDLPIPDPAAVHEPVDEAGKEYLIFGNIPIDEPAADLPPELSAILGRWEGTGYDSNGTPSIRIVLVVQEIDQRGGQAYVWAGSNLFKPDAVKQVRFRVVSGPAIEWDARLDDFPINQSDAKGRRGTFRVFFDGEKKLQGEFVVRRDGSVVPLVQLEPTQTFFTFLDFEAYLADRRITYHNYQDEALRLYGEGYAVYLPPDYEQAPEQTWPLLVSLIGTGERGKNLYTFLKNGPLKEVSQGMELPFIIVQPMFNVLAEHRSFPEDYLDGVMDLVLADYRVDPRRIYLTGISMGGEATYRYALHRPELFAAIAPLAAFDARYLPSSQAEGFKPFELPMSRIKDVPVWAIHGDRDPIVTLAAAQQTADALAQAGGNVRFTILPGHGHDVWTDTYADPAFYTWLLENTND